MPKKVTRRTHRKNILTRSLLGSLTPDYIYGRSFISIHPLGKKTNRKSRITKIIQKTEWHVFRIVWPPTKQKTVKKKRCYILVCRHICCFGQTFHDVTEDVDRLRCVAAWTTHIKTVEWFLFACVFRLALVIVCLCVALCHEYTILNIWVLKKWKESRAPQKVMVENSNLSNNFSKSSAISCIRFLIASPHTNRTPSLPSTFPRIFLPTSIHINTFRWQIGFPTIIITCKYSKK